MTLNIEKDFLFTINKPYLHVTQIEENEIYSVYCDGSYIKLPHDSFACIGGVILNKEGVIVGEFFGPLKTKDVLGLEVLPRFEFQAINLAVSVSKHLKMKNFTIFNDSMTDVDKVKSLNSNSVDIRWITRKENIADSVVSYAKNIWKKEQDTILLNLKKRKLLFNKKSDFKISLHSYKKNGYYFIAVTQDNSILKHFFSLSPDHFGEINLIINMLNQGNLTNCSFVITRNLFDRLQKYASGQSQIKVLDIYEKMFKVIFDYPYMISFELREGGLKITDKDLHKNIKEVFG